jgi:hypothetical protein
VSEEIWLVSFMNYDLGYFDHETCRLEPIENPFGPKLLGQATGSRAPATRAKPLASAPLAWPPPVVPWQIAYSESLVRMLPPLDRSPEHYAAAAAARLEEGRRVTAHYQHQARQREERENEEARERQRL